MKILKTSTLIALALVFAGNTLTLSAAPAATQTFTDKFNGTKLDPASWYQYKVEKARLAPMDGKLNFIVGANPASNNYATAEYLARYPGFTENWTFTISLSNTSGLGTRAGCGFMICHSQDRSDYLFVEFYGKSGIAGGVFANNQHVKGGLAKNLPLSQGKIRIQYANKVMKFLVSPTGETGTWVKIGTFSPTATSAGIAANLHADWNMEPTDTFGIQLLGFSEAKRVAAGKITLDNFTLTAPAPVATP